MFCSFYETSPPNGRGRIRKSGGSRVRFGAFASVFVVDEVVDPTATYVLLHCKSPPFVCYKVSLHRNQITVRWIRRRQTRRVVCLDQADCRRYPRQDVGPCGALLYSYKWELLRNYRFTPSCSIVSSYAICCQALKASVILSSYFFNLFFDFIEGSIVTIFPLKSRFHYWYFKVFYHL